MTADPDLKTTPNGKSVTDFTLAVDNFKDGEKQTDFILCTVFGTKAEMLCKYNTKGSKLALIGKLHVDKYKDKNGNDRYKTYVTVQEVEYLSSKGARDPENGQVTDDDLPF